MAFLDWRQSPFDLLSADEQAILTQEMDIEFHAENTVILSPEIPINALYVVIKGVVVEMDANEILSFYRAGEMFDTKSVIPGKTYHTFVAQEEALLQTLPRETLLRLTNRNPPFGAYLYASISEKLGLLAQRSGRREWHTLMTARVRDALCRQPVFVEATKSVYEVAQSMKTHKTKSVLIRKDGKLGIFTTTDFRDLIGQHLSLEHAIGDYATFSLLTVSASEFLFNALLLMTRHNIRRLVVMENEQAIGILSQVDVLSYFSNHSHLIAYQLERAQNLDELTEAASKITQLISELSNNGMKAVPLGRLVQSLSMRLFAKTWQCIAPPEIISHSCLLMLGSEGRGEQILKTDQDNALIIQDGFEHPELARCCSEFSDTLARFGYPPCPGQIMISYPRWRLPLHQWKQRLREWIHNPIPLYLMELSIFMDADAVCGDAALLSACQKTLYGLVQDDSSFFARFAQPVEQFSTPLGYWSHLKTQSQNGKAILDIKKGGIFPLVHGIRALALEYGIRERHTHDRLLKLSEAGRLDKAMASDIKEAFAILQDLKLTHGLKQLQAGSPADNLLEPEKLSNIERDLLKEALIIVKQFKALLHQHFRLGHL